MDRKVERTSRKLTQEQKQSLLDDWDRVQDTAFLMRKYGMSRPGILYILKQNGRQTKTPTFLTKDQEDQIIQLRQQGTSLEDIVLQVGQKLSTVRNCLAKRKVKLSKEQHKANMREHSQKTREEIINLRLQNKTREEIAQTLGVPLSFVKTVLSETNTILPMEQRQANSQAALKAKNPNHMEDMRKHLTPEVLEKRTQSIAEAYKNPELVRLKTEQNRNFWANVSQEFRDKWAEKHRGANSGMSKKSYETKGLANIEELMQHYASMHSGKYLGGYVNTKEKCRWECSKGHVFETIPNVVQQGHWCPICTHVGPSKGQLEVYEYVKSLLPGKEVQLNTRDIISPKELDVYIPDLKFAIEYNGLLWHSSYTGKTPKSHLQKFRACEEAGVRLFAFYEDEWANKRELVKAMIRFRVGAFSGTKLSANDLELRKVTGKYHWQSFFDRNHLDGSANASVGYGLYLGDKLIMCATVRKNFAGEFEIARMATDYDYIVHGGAHRLLKAIKQDFPIIYTYSNNRLSDGNVYRQNGFEKVQDNAPSYWYTDGAVRVWRFRCKRINDPEILAQYPTERAQAEGGVFSRKYLGHDRPMYAIYDYGHQKWVAK